MKVNDFMLPNVIARVKKVNHYIINDSNGNPYITKCVISTYPNGKNFSAKAKLDPKNTFDNQFGKDLSYARALDKLAIYNNRLINEASETLIKEFRERQKAITKIGLLNYDKNMEPATSLYKKLVNQSEESDN